MILSSDDLPAPFAPRTPILAPGRKESEMSFNTSRPGPKDFESPEVTYTYCGEAMRLRCHAGGTAVPAFYRIAGAAATG